jgi:hypothetical protein
MRSRLSIVLVSAFLAGGLAACGQAGAADPSTAGTTTVLIKAQPTIDVRAHYAITLICGAHASLTGKGITVAGAKAAPACAFLAAHPTLFTTRHICMTVDGGSAAVVETRQGSTVRSCIGGNMGTDAEGRLLRRFQALVFSRG